jgi:hypothetical protein
MYYLGELYREHRDNCERALELFERSWAADPGSRAVHQAAIDCAKRLARLDVVARLTAAWKEQGRE